MDKNLKNYTYDRLCDLTGSFSEKKYLAKYIFSFIHRRDISTIEQISPLSRNIRGLLRDNGYYISSLKVIDKFADPDGTVKLLFQARDEVRFETVLMVDRGRKTLCISTQAGCRMGCRFCATAKLKFTRNLTAGEIAGQVTAAGALYGKINNVVYMGMGEPLDNYPASIDSLKILTHSEGLNIGQRHITLSTCGLADKIRDFTDQGLGVRLAVSLHGAEDNTRRKLMPAAKTNSVRELIEALKYYQKKTNRRITVEYCMIKDINDSLPQAADLAGLLKPIKANVNLIEFNPHPGCEFKASGSKRIKQFADELNSRGIEAVIRYKRGRTIKAACGQLGAELLKKENQIEKLIQD